MCECAGVSTSPPSSSSSSSSSSPPPPYVGVSEVSHKKTKSGTKKHKLGKRKKSSNELQPVRCKVRSVVSTVSTWRERKEEEEEEEGGSWGRKRRQKESEETRMTGRRKRKRRRRRVRSCLLRSCEAESVSVSVRRKRRPRRSLYDEEEEEEVVGGDEEDEGRQRHRVTDGDADAFPWRPHSSLHSSFFSPGCNSTAFWERGHHSNPRSFIDCCYPDNSCGDGSSPARKRKLPHWDRKFIHSKRKSESARRLGGGVCFGDGGLISDWMRGHGDDGGTRWRWRHGAGRTEVERFSPNSSSWGRRSGHLSNEDVDWDRRSVDRWTWGSGSDGWDDRRRLRSTSGDNRDGDSPGRGWRCAGARRSSSRRFSSPDEWWTSGRTYGPRGGGGHSPRSCSPCSSTSLSELSWGWSRSSTCSGGMTAPQEAQKQNDFTSTTSSPVRSAPRPSPPPSQSDLRPGSSSSSSSSGSSSSETNPPGPKPAARTLLLPLIGKLPAIQRKARRKKWLLEKSQEKEEEEEEEEGGGRKDMCSSRIGTEDKETTTTPISFTAEEMDKYRFLQEQAREHMQKVLENVDSGPGPGPGPGPGSGPGPGPGPGLGPGPGPGPGPGALQAPPPPPLPPHDSFTQPLPLRLPRLPPLHHIILQHTGLTLPPPSSPTTTTSSSSSPPPPPPPPSPVHSHPLPPPLPHHLHLSPFSISSLFPSILLSSHHHHHLPLLPPQPFPTSPLAPLSAVALQPLTPQPFVDRVWPVRFQQKAL